MFYVQHLVIENVLDGELRNARTIHSAIQQNLIGAGIEAAELAAPTAQAPADGRALQYAGKILLIEFFKKHDEIKMPSFGTAVARAHALAAHLADAFTGAIGFGVVDVWLRERTLRPLAIDTRKEKSGSAFENIQRRAIEEIGETHEQRVAAAANREDQAAVGIKFDAEVRRAAFAANAREHALKQRFAAGNAFDDAAGAGQFLRLTGGGAAFFFCFSVS